MYNITTSNGGTVTTANGQAILQTSAATNGSAQITSTKPATHRPGQGILARFTPMWTGGFANSKQLFGMGTDIDGYFFGFNGATFGIFHRLNSIDTHIPQTSWNVDKCDGTGTSGFAWNTSKGSPLMVKYPYLGHGNISFWILNSETSVWILCHVIKYSNLSSLPQLSNPNLLLYGQVINSGNANNLTMYITCAGVHLDGPREYIGPQFGIDNNKTITTENNIITLKNATTVNGVPNRGLARLRTISLAYDGGNGVCQTRIKKGSTVAGSPVFNAIDGVASINGTVITSANSIISYDVAGTTLSGGKILFNSCLARNSNLIADLTNYNIFIAPGEFLTISMAATASGICSVALNWQEDVQ